MTIRLAGLASGIDVETLVSGLVGAARAPITSLTSKRTELSSASQTVSSISSKLSTLKSAALALSTAVGFASGTASSSDTAVVASVSGSAPPGNFSVQVNALAQEQRTRSDAQSSSTTALGMSGTLSLTVGSGAATNVSIGATDTLTDIATKIAGSGARVNASILFDGSSYRLTVRGMDTGAENAISFGEGGSIALGLTTPANTYQSAQNASLTVDGLAISSKTNQVTGVIQGVNLALTKTTSAPVNVTVASDNGALKTKINAFITAYNDIVNTGHNVTGYGTIKATNQTLAGDSSIRSVLNALGGIMSSAVPGTSGRYQSLGSVGVQLKSDGTLSMDATKFDAAMTADPIAVRKLFITDTTIGATGAMKTFMDTADKLTVGSKSVIGARLEALGTRQKAISKSIDTMEDRMTAYENQLRQQFATLDQQITQSNGMSSSLSALSVNYYK